MLLLHSSGWNGRPAFMRWFQTALKPHTTRWHSPSGVPAASLHLKTVPVHQQKTHHAGLPVRDELRVHTSSNPHRPKTSTRRCTALIGTAGICSRTTVEHTILPCRHKAATDKQVPTILACKRSAMRRPFMEAAVSTNCFRSSLSGCARMPRGTHRSSTNAASSVPDGKAALVVPGPRGEACGAEASWGRL